MLVGTTGGQSAPVRRESDTLDQVLMGFWKSNHSARGQVVFANIKSGVAYASIAHSNWLRATAKGCGCLVAQSSRDGVVVELKYQRGPTAGHLLRDQLAQVLRLGAMIQQTLAHEIRKLVKFLLGQRDGRRQERIDALKHGLDRPAQGCEVRGDTGVNRIIVTRGSEHVEMMAHRVLEPCEAAVVEESGLQGHIAQRRGAELVAIIHLSCDLLQTEVFILARTIKNHIADQRGDLRNADDVLLEIAEHLVC